ncbi:secA translation regulator SecM [Actinobacillus delphinicola]|uniref:Protein of uncharacterized function (DUF2547) n=1 Tax=Actinobacillus delphinicola TaxID=51161 RepID=A0A448TT95_9PAST|nr:secA translation regulator SecM [Actinobacillus delphinicola]VEJ09053.1 Protein of uncharacterised function (DUF2547) [Actinobacillus delphinicola]
MIKSKSYFWSPLLIGLLAIFSLANSHHDSQTGDPVSVQTLMTQLQKNSVAVQQQMADQQLPHHFTHANVDPKFERYVLGQFSHFFFLSILIRAGPEHRILTF